MLKFYKRSWFMLWGSTGDAGGGVPPIPLLTNDANTLVLTNDAGTIQLLPS